MIGMCDNNNNALAKEENKVDNNNNNNTAKKKRINFGLYDVLCGRDKMAFNNIGNRRLRVTVSMYLDRFMATKKTDRKEKGAIIDAVVRSVQDNGGRFLAWSATDGCHVVIHRKRAYEKCSHLFRDMALSVARNHARHQQGQRKYNHVQKAKDAIATLSCYTPARHSTHQAQESSTTLMPTCQLQQQMGFAAGVAAAGSSSSSSSLQDSHDKDMDEFYMRLENSMFDDDETEIVWTTCQKQPQHRSASFTSTTSGVSIVTDSSSSSSSSYCGIMAHRDAFKPEKNSAAVACRAQCTDNFQEEDDDVATLLLEMDNDKLLNFKDHDANMNDGNNNNDEMEEILLMDLLRDVEPNRLVN